MPTDRTCPVRGCTLPLEAADALRLSGCAAGALVWYERARKAAIASITAQAGGL